MQPNFSFHFLGRRISILLLSVSLCMTFAVSDEDDAASPTEISDIDQEFSNMPDFSYFTLPDETPPTDFQSSWYNGLDDKDVNTSPTFPPQSTSWWARSPDTDVSRIAEENPDEASTINPNIIKADTTIKLSTLISTLQPQITSQSTITVTTNDSSLLSTKSQTSIAVITEQSAIPTISPVLSSEEISSMLPVSTEMSQTMPFISSTSATSTVSSPQFCYKNSSSIYMTECGYCSVDIGCRPGDIKESLNPCRYSTFIPGCMFRCKHIYQRRVCCYGYWGEVCDECPGGYQNPCNGRGDCQTNNGICLCQSGFTGTACEVCEDLTKYGLDCSQNCSCVYGVCNSGATGDGSCFCDTGYKGEKCDTARNPCDGAVSLCGNYSHCVHTGPDQHNCTCNEDYAGDGIVCIPINPCQTNRGGCSSTATCIQTGPNRRACLCEIGYKSDGTETGCSLADACFKEACDPNAQCVTVARFKFSCKCNDGYIANGNACHGNILQRIKSINDNDPRFKQDLNYVIKLISNFYLEPLTKHGPFTMFLPNDRAFRDVIKANKGFNNFLEDEDRAIQILRQHILIGLYKLEDLQSFDKFYTLQGNAAQLQIRASRDIFRYKLQGGSDRAKIMAKNFLASNGIIHIVNNLLTLEPEISGDKKKTALDLIKQETTYNRFESMIISAGLSDIFTQPNITVFAPENGAWDDLITGTIDYLMTDEEGLEKLKVILKNHVFSGVFGVTDLINTPRIKSLANDETKVTVSSLGQIQLNEKVTISQVNIPCSTGFYHHIESVLIPSYMDKILPNRCSEILTKEVKGICINCHYGTPTCPQPGDVPTEKTTVCTYYSSSWAGVKSFSGCSRICNREVKAPKCCPGFYGADCIPCPGGYRTPCNGQGKCSDGITGTGLCFCESDYMGTACEQCRQKDVFGPICNETCTCLYGHCDDGPKGTGTCKNATCQQGFIGENCDQKLIPCNGNDIMCHAHAKCFIDDNDVARCQCEVGYEKDGEDCIEIDPCEKDNGECHQQATCTKLGPGVSRCECNIGWSGDGFDCSPKTSCQEHTDCHINAKCYNAEPGQYHCVCQVGYKGDGKNCDLVNLCVDNNGGCHPKAICTPLKANERNCSCPTNLAGDGFMCSGTIADEVMAHPNLTLLASLLKVLDRSNNMLDNIEDNMTFFAPSDLAMESFMAWFKSWNRTSYWEDQENIVWFLNFHTIYSYLSTQDLIALESILKSFPTMYDGFSLHIVKINDVLRIFVNHSEFATITQPAIPTMNGYIHIIDRVLEPFLPDDQVPTLNETLSSQPKYELFYQAMQITGVLDEIKDLDDFTVFVPSNDAFKRLNRTINAEFIKYYIVPKLVFTPSIVDSETFETLLGSQQRLLLSVSQNTVEVNGVAIVRSDVLLDGGVMHEIGGVLHPVLSRCDFNSTDVQFGECGDCTNLNLTCPPDYFSLSPPRIIKYECYFRRYPDAGWQTIGCQQICSKNIIKPECCRGYFGPLCKDCPGGAENPCSGNGMCFGGLEGNGICSCDKGFSGLECSNCEGKDLAPPYCNVTYNSCGYRNGNCSEHAVCIDTSSGVSCRCRLGYVGDGYTCRSQCDILDRCHPQADCLFNVSKLAVQCICKQGYHGNGSWCEQNIDTCASQNGGCDPDRAICTPVIPKVTDMFQNVFKDSVNCSCKKGYSGNGIICSTDLLDAISRIPELKYFWERLREDGRLNNTNVTQRFSDHKASSTLFLPVSNDWDTLDMASLVVDGGEFWLPNYPENNSYDINDKEKEIYNTVLEQLESLNGQIINLTVNSKKQLFANDVRIVQVNINTPNGVIYLTEVPIMRSYEHGGVAASRNKGGSNSTVLITCVVVGVAIVLVALIVAVIYIKKHRKDFFKFFKPTQASSESNISFARLSAQEEEDDAFKASDNPRYDNPIFNDPDLL